MRIGSKWLWYIPFIVSSVLAGICGQLMAKEGKASILPYERAQAAVDKATRSSAVTITVSVPMTQVQTGDMLTVTVDIERGPGGCPFAMMDLTLSEEEPARFRFASPQRLGPPAPSHATYLLLARHPGSTSFVATAFGEKYCDGSWSWSSRRGSSMPISVTGAALNFEQFLPLVVQP